MVHPAHMAVLQNPETVVAIAGPRGLAPHVAPETRVAGDGGDEFRSPLCQSPNGEYGLTQYFARATPALRQLQVQELLARDPEGPTPLVGSICAKTIDPRAPDFAYNPTMDALHAAMAPYIEGVDGGSGR